ncbi:O-antigen ligase family protein [Clostridium sp. AL.422]|uniref:O-antigen ligase family protein n=1 Tax=Clostridium TaxID=1485 RepID=UPI00293DE0B8|nr:MULTISPECIES: O-antigen ligase family protein [unclassified Clostridium]MDV4150292.1 O-antigen ligase family protein [Clostridium sp. AL.422]
MRITSNFKICRDSIFIFLCILAFIVPEYLLMLPYISRFYDIYRVLISLILVVKLIFRMRYNKFTLLWIIFEAWIVLVTIIRGGSITYSIKMAVIIISLAVLFEIYSDKPVTLYKNIYYIFELFIYINFITLLLFPNGMYSTGVVGETTENWFLGFKNKHLTYFLPATGITLILCKLEKFNFRRILLLIVTFISALYVKSGTGLLCLSVLYIIVLAPFIKKKYKIFNMRTYLCAIIIMLFAIPILRLQYLFSYIIVVILKKDINLTYRTEIWDTALNAISQHPIIGWGEQGYDVRQQLYSSNSIISAHNQILEYLYIGGIISMILYFIINIMMVKKTSKYAKFEATQIVSALYLALHIALIAEVYVDASMYMIYFMVWYIDSVCREYPQGKYKQIV